MKLKYKNLISGEKGITRAKITTNHSASSYGQPIIVLSTGEALDLMSWVCCGYQVISASAQEKEQLNQMGLI